MVAALAQLEREREVHHAAGAEIEHRRVRPQARAVGGDENVRDQGLAMRLGNLAQSWRADFLAGFEEHTDVEAERAATGRQDLRQRREIDRVLPLVVGGAAAIDALALDSQAPGPVSPCPAVALAADDVAMPVGEHGRHVVAFPPFRDQEGAARRDRILDASPAKSDFFERRTDFLLQVGVQLVAATFLAFSLDRDSACEVGMEAAAVEIVECAGGGLSSVHASIPVARA